MHIWLQHSFYRLYQQFRLPRLCIVLFAILVFQGSFTPIATLAADTEPKDTARPQESAQQQQETQQQETRNDAQAAVSTPDTPENSSSESTSDAERIRDAIEAVRTDNSLPEELRTRCQEVLTNTLKDIESQVQDQQLMETLAQAARSSEQRKKVAERLEDQEINIPLNGVTAESDGAQIEELLRTLNKQLLSTTAEANKIQQQLNERRTETKELPIQISQTEEELATLSSPIETKGENPVLTSALKQATVAKRAKLETILELAQQKIITYDVA